MLVFSRYCPSFLDLPHFVVWECCGATAEECSSRSKWLKHGPSPARGQILEIWDLEIQKFGIYKMLEMKMLQIQIRSTTNVGKVWISRKNTFPAPFGAYPGHFLCGPKKYRKCTTFGYFPWWANGPYSPCVGSCAGVIIYLTPSS